jgi:hypothetical protein
VSRLEWGSGAILIESSDQPFDYTVADRDANRCVMRAYRSPYPYGAM